MSKSRPTHRAPAGLSAAEWYVDLDAESPDRATEAELASWLAEDARREAAFERCEAAVWLAARLEGEPELDWAFAEARALAQAEPRRPPARRLGWLLAAGVAAAAVAVALWPPAPEEAAPAVASVGVEPGVPPVEPDAPALEPDAPPLEPLEPPVELVELVELAEPPAEPSSRSPISRALLEDAVAASAPVVLPGQVVVDAGSVAVLPFMTLRREAADGAYVAHYDAGLATELHRGVVEALEEIPGVYVINPHAVTPYARLELPASEVAAQLGVRGVVTGRVRAQEGRVSVRIELVDAADGARLWALETSRPAGELASIQTESAAAVAAALAGAERRRAATAPVTVQGPRR